MQGIDLTAFLTDILAGGWLERWVERVSMDWVLEESGIGEEVRRQRS